jgi:uncharacterized protein (DUF2384 family)
MRVPSASRNLRIHSRWVDLVETAPLSLLNRGIGAESLMDTLGRIEQGMFA